MQKKLLIVLLADKNGLENQGRALHALLYAKQAIDAGIQTKLIFDGGGSEWALEMATETGKYHDKYKELLEKGVILGVCQFCAKAFHVENELQLLDTHFIKEDQGHPNVAKYIADDFTVITI